MFDNLINHHVSHEDYIGWPSSTLGGEDLCMLFVWDGICSRTIISWFTGAAKYIDCWFGICETEGWFEFLFY